MAYKFPEIIDSRGYHVYKNVIWDRVKAGDRNWIKAMSGNLTQLKIVGQGNQGNLKAWIVFPKGREL